MSNMSYCRFRNTVLDLEDCLENLATTSSGEEMRARFKLVLLCRELVTKADRLGIDLRDK